MKRIFSCLLIVLIGFSCLFYNHADAQDNAKVLDPIKWKFTSKRINNAEAELIFTAFPDKGWHLYSQFTPQGGPIPTLFIFSDSSNTIFKKTGKATESPKPETYYEPLFETNVYQFAGKATFIQKIKLLVPGAITIRGEISYMSCNEETCVPLYTDFEFKMDGLTGDQQYIQQVIDTLVKAENKDTVTSDSSQQNITADAEKTPIAVNKKISDKLNSIEETNSLWLIFWLAFGMGFISIFTPCVLPMIPMTVSFFMKDMENKAKGKKLAVIFGISIIVIFIIFGLIFAIIFGPDTINYISTSWAFNIFCFLIFLIFAAAFFGMFEIRLPSWIINKSDQQADKGGFMGPFFMALTLIIVSFSCTFPIIGSVLVMVSGGKFLQPVIAMLGYSMAFALPFTVFAFSPQLINSLPKSGGWMNSLKVILGFIEVAFAFKFLSVADQTYHWRIMDREIYLAIWIVIFTLMGFYLLGKIKFKHDNELKFISVPRLAIVIITFSFVIYLLPGMFGAPLKMLSGWLPPEPTHDFDIKAIIRDYSEKNVGEICEQPKYADKLHLPHGLKGYFDYDQGLKCAKALNKPVFVDFTGHGCVNCRKMEEYVWKSPEVLKRLENDFLIITLYVDDKSIQLPEEEWYISEFDGKQKKTLGKKNADIQIKKYKQNSQPQYILLDPDGNKLVEETRGYKADVDAFVKFLDQGLDEFKKRTGNK